MSIYYEQARHTYRYAATYYFRALFPSVLQGFRFARNNSNAYYFNMLLRTLALANIGYKTFAPAKVQLFSDIHKKNLHFACRFNDFLLFSSRPDESIASLAITFLYTKNPIRFAHFGKILYLCTKIITLMEATVDNIPQSGIEIYVAPDNSVQLQVKLDQDTVWLTQKQLAELFGVKKAAISKHVSNIFAVGELDPLATVSKMETVQIEGTRTIVRQVDYYNLDMILSIGYRVNSKSAIAFRQWANKVLKDYLVKGYAFRTNLQIKQYEELKQLVSVLQHTMQTEALTTNDARDLVNVVTDYTYALDTLDNYDYQRLAISDTEGIERFHATYENAMEAIHSLKEKFGESWLFGNEKDDSFKSSIGQIYQTFGGQELYPSVEEKAAMLLYLVTKNHSFSDGNKRIAATLFLWFMDRNGILYTPEGNKRIADNTLVALTLMIAESRTEEKDVMVKVVVNLINKKN